MLNQSERPASMHWKRDIFSSTKSEKVNLGIMMYLLNTWNEISISGALTKPSSLLVEPPLSCGYSIFISFISFSLYLPRHWGGHFCPNTHAGCFTAFILLSAACLSVIHNKDLLATIHLLVAMVKQFQPELDLPPNVKVEVVVVEVSLRNDLWRLCLSV